MSEFESLSDLNSGVDKVREGLYKTIDDAYDVISGLPNHPDFNKFRTNLECIIHYMNQAEDDVLSLQDFIQDDIENESEELV